jgi:hypothetical protein
MPKATETGPVGERFAADPAADTLFCETLMAIRDRAIAVHVFDGGLAVHTGAEDVVRHAAIVGAGQGGTAHDRAGRRADHGINGQRGIGGVQRKTVFAGRGEAILGMGIPFPVAAEQVEIAAAAHQEAGRVARALERERRQITPEGAHGKAGHAQGRGLRFHGGRQEGVAGGKGLIGEAEG